MAYYSGISTGWVDLANILSDALTASEGWQLADGILSKGNVHVQITADANGISLLAGTGKTGAALINPAPTKVMLRRFGTSAPAVTWPVSYELHAFAGEVYLVINHDTEYYMFAAFGQSIVQGLEGTGVWVAASCRAQSGGYAIQMSANSYAGDLSYIFSTPAIFMRTHSNSMGWGFESYVHTGFDGRGWNQDAQTTSIAYGQAPGITPLYPLLYIQPNTWNSEAVLLPMRCYIYRPEYKITLVADLQHARHTRLENYDPGQIITLGTDRWKVYPWFKKYAPAGGNVYNGWHTGTLGWAVRYEGP